MALNVAFYSITRSYIDLSTVVSWTESLFDVIVQLCEKNDSLRSTMERANLLSSKGSTSNEALQSKVQELQMLVHTLEQREISLRSKLNQQGRIVSI